MHLISPDEIAAIVVEPIQGEGGYIVPPKAFLQGLRELASEHGIVLVCDEVQSGMGRTGKMFALEHFGSRPTSSTSPRASRPDCRSASPARRPRSCRGLRARMPARSAATRFRAPRQSRRSSCSKEQYVANAATVGAHLMDGLRALQQKHPIIGDVRGMGLMIGVELVKDRTTKERAVDERNALVQAMFRRGVLILGAGRNAVRFAPPLVLSKDQADSVLATLDESLSEVVAGVR